MIDPPVPYRNPTAEVHAQLTRFFESRATTGRAEIAAPMP
jgi:hypothetical protein